MRLAEQAGGQANSWKYLVLKMAALPAREEVGDESEVGAKLAQSLQRTGGMACWGRQAAPAAAQTGSLSVGERGLAWQRSRNHPLRHMLVKLSPSGTGDLGHRL